MRRTSGPVAKAMGRVRITSWYPNFNGSHIWLTTQLDPQNDWTGWQIHVTYDAFALAPSHNTSNRTCTHYLRVSKTPTLEAILACLPGLSTEWLGWVAISCELCHMRTDPIQKAHKQRSACCDCTFVLHFSWNAVDWGGGGGGGQCSKASNQQINWENR